MLLLILYVVLALGVSFLCSIAEAVMLSVTSTHVALLMERGSPTGSLLRSLREDINRPLAAILTLNTVAHTVGAAGAGAQAAEVFGSNSVGIASAVLTLLILILSEIIPKTLGAVYWKSLAPPTAHLLRLLIWLLYPVIRATEWLTRGLTHGPTLRGFNRDELAAMATLSTREGQLSEAELRILKNLLRLRQRKIEDEMTPRTVVFSLPEKMSVSTFVASFRDIRFSRIPLYAAHPEAIDGFALRSDLLLAHAQGKTDQLLAAFKRPMPHMLESMKLAQAFDLFLQKRSHIMLVLDEYGGMAGILTLEDLIEALIGKEIVDEGDTTADMRELARRIWRERVAEMGLEFDERED